MTAPADPPPPPDLPGSLAPRLPSPLTEAVDDRLARHGVRLLLKRDDLVHPDLPEYMPTGVSGADRRS